MCEAGLVFDNLGINLIAIVNKSSVPVSINKGNLSFAYTEKIIGGSISFN